MTLLRSREQGREKRAAAARAVANVEDGYGLASKIIVGRPAGVKVIER